MKAGDRLLIAALAVGLLIAWPLATAVADPSGGQVTIQGPAGTSTLSLAHDADLVIEGLTGEVHVRVRQGTVRVTEADCPDRVCVHTGPASAPGSVIACVPNAVVLRIEGRGDAGLDGIVR